MRGPLPATAMLLLLAGLGCPSSSSSDDMASTSTSGSSSSSDGGSSTTGPIAPADSSTGPSLPWPPDDGITECMQSCVGPFDCCPVGSEGSCPGPYPFNIDCINGLCVPGSCESDEECTAVDAATVCRPVGGLPICVVLCDGDAACEPAGTGFSCSEQTDEGESYCFERCDVGFVPCANQTCDPDNGHCVCESSGQCLNGWQCA